MSTTVKNFVNLQPAAFGGIIAALTSLITILTGAAPPVIAAVTTLVIALQAAFVHQTVTPVAKLQEPGSAGHGA